MVYTAAKPPLPETTEQLRARIPGWGVDRNPQDRPAVPRLQFNPDATGAHWEFPERQPEKRSRERSIEHEFLTPVFGTSSPTHGLSGAIRKYSYRRYSEARAAHWLLLIAADRVDSMGSNLRSYLTLKPDNPFSETGVRAEFTHHGVASRRGKKRADVKHHAMDPLIVAAPWVARAAVGYGAVRSIVRYARRR